MSGSGHLVPSELAPPLDAEGTRETERCQFMTFQLFWFTRGPPNVMHEALRGWPLLVLQ
ncbi:hypothetical protein PVAP13_1KG167730 [Panicum virgatum]|uniref:Uncharacterized protein n=1 Tax=Panicum virgatum TaxID=38727 RepID=A0A8T0XFE5_PANVG|nr:hypothetical protein PVAP13_1KG167730 [Panicum virgatum]